MLKRIQLVSELRDEDVAAMKGKRLHECHFTRLFSRENVALIKPDGSPLLVLLHHALDLELCKRVYPSLLSAAQWTDQRGDASGGRRPSYRRDGMLSKVTRANKVRSGIIGYYDRTPRFPYCRATAFTAEQVRKWPRIIPYAQAVNSVFQCYLPDRYAAQLGFVKRTPLEYIIDGTVFSTITVNHNYAPTVHRDKGDLEQGFGVLSVIRRGSYKGCYLVFPRYEVAVDLHSQDVLLADVHEPHGSTAFVSTGGGYSRLSTVFYYRAGMRKCGTPEEEIARLKRRY